MAAPNVENRTLFHGDNLDFLRGMNSGSVHLIATDPPFNKGRDFHATPDSLAAGARFQDRWTWEDDAHQEWQDAVQDDYPAAWAVIDWARMTYGDDMGAFLCFMGVRLMEMRRILRDDGSIYLHCDPTASHYLKNLMDAIFGRRNFRNEIVWRRTHAAKAGSRDPLQRSYGSVYDILLFYSRTADAKVRIPKVYPDGYKSEFRYSDSVGRYRIHRLVASGGMHKSPLFEWNGLNPQFGWLYNKEGMDRLEREGRIHYNNRGTPYRKEYADEYSGRPVSNFWVDIPIALGKERSGYPTQKPLALYERIIRASSNPGDMVLDPFCGCATTCVAAERLERQWVGVDIWEGAYDQVITRLEAEGLASEEVVPDRLFTFGDITYTDEPPERDDEGETAAPYLPVRQRRHREEWERLSRKEIVDILVEAQSDRSGVACGGCGRVLEKEFMELDHITPRAGNGSNDITNRILLCSPCNRRKKENLTLPGLVNDNKRTGWMRDEARAAIARSKAHDAANRVRDEKH